MPKRERLNAINDSSTMIQPRLGSISENNLEWFNDQVPPLDP